MDGSTSDQRRFADIFGATSGRVYGYARRRSDAATAQDVVSETFLIAWRRRDEIPDDPLPWLLGVARNVTRNLGRKLVREHGLVEVLTAAQSGTSESAEASAVERQSVFSTLATLSERDREALLLVAWDGLSTAQAAVVVGCSPNAFAVRLSRARARLRADRPPGQLRVADLPTT